MSKNEKCCGCLDPKINLQAYVDSETRGTVYGVCRECDGTFEVCRDCLRDGHAESCPTYQRLIAEAKANPDGVGCPHAIGRRGAMGSAGKP